MADWYIRPDGNNGNPGTGDSPSLAFQTFAPIEAGGSAGAVAGDRVFPKGAGTDTPPIGSPDYILSSIVTPVRGTYAQSFQIIGFNGRPRIHASGACFSAGGNRFENLYLCATGTVLGTVLIGSDTLAAVGSEAENVVFDQNGYNLNGTSINNTFGCEFCNSDTGGFRASLTGGDGMSAYSKPAAIYNVDGEPGPDNFGSHVGNYIHNWQGTGISHPNSSSLDDNLIVACALFGIDDGIYFWKTVKGNTVIECGLSGMRLSSHDANGGSETLRYNLIRNNLLGYNGTYGLYVDGTSALSLASGHQPDYNAYIGNGTAKYINVAAGAHDVVLTSDPFVNRAGKDYRLTAAANSAIGRASWPTAYRGVTA